MISENINTATLMILGIFLVLLVIFFAMYALRNGNNMVTLEDSVRTALIDNRDDGSRVNSSTLYPLDVNNFERQVRETKLQENGGRNKQSTQFKFYYLLQNGNLYDTRTYQKKLADGSNHLNRTGGTTLVKAVTVDATVNSDAVSRHDHFKNEKTMKSPAGTKRYSVTYIVDGGVVKNPGKNNDEASRILPKDYQQAKKQQAHDEKYGVKSNTMVNLTDN